MLVSGLRAGTLYTICRPAFDPRWSPRDVQRFLAWCATAQHLGWEEPRAVRTAESIVMRQKLEGIVWPEGAELESDVAELEGAAQSQTFQ